jgi:dTDP-4-dehydrorhamnose 3,5-epimerase
VLNNGLKPSLIKGGIFSDHRGSLKFVNDFTLDDVSRFYTITQSPEHGARAWQGHKTESKAFHCLKGAFAIRLAKIEDWENPGEPEISAFTLSASESEILLIPGGYANGLKALKADSQLLIFSEMTTEEAKNDEQRFETQKWINWDKI